jgi:hypothetical protein
MTDSQDHMRVPLYQRMIRTIAFAILGLTAFGTVLDALSNAVSLVTPRTTYLGTVLLVVGLLATNLLLRTWPLPWYTAGVQIRIKNTGPKTTAVIVGMIALLWLPRWFDHAAHSGIGPHSAKANAKTPPGAHVKRNVSSLSAQKQSVSSTMGPVAPVMVPERPRRTMLLVDTSQDAPELTTTACISRYVESAGKTPTGLATYDRTFHLRLPPGNYEVMQYLRYFDPRSGTDCANLHNALESVMQYMKDDPNVDERLVVIGSAFKWPCSKPEAVWDFEERYSHINVTFVLVGLSRVEEVKRLFPRATLDMTGHLKMY